MLQTNSCQANESVLPSNVGYRNVVQVMVPRSHFVSLALKSSCYDFTVVSLSLPHLPMPRHSVTLALSTALRRKTHATGLKNELNIRRAHVTEELPQTNVDFVDRSAAFIKPKPRWCDFIDISATWQTYATQLYYLV